MDVGSLFDQLIAAGIIKPAASSAAAEAAPAADQRGEKSQTANVQQQQPKEVKLTEVPDLSTFKERLLQR